MDHEWYTPVHTSVGHIIPTPELKQVGKLSQPGCCAQAAPQHRQAPLIPPNTEKKPPCFIFLLIYPMCSTFMCTCASSNTPAMQHNTLILIVGMEQNHAWLSAHMESGGPG
mmetsp:Transcript_31561/g.56668  ORF Transcript_31561/g.56668 Transcript_31561/m.56668 type:complete len:111 (-) Transcript_31561:731-1063(-)